MAYVSDGKEKFPCFVCGHPFRKGQIRKWARVPGFPEGSTSAHQECYDRLTPKERVRKARLKADQRDNSRQHQLTLRMPPPAEQYHIESAGEWGGSRFASILRDVSKMKVPASVTIASDSNEITITFPGFPDTKAA